MPRKRTGQVRFRKGKWYARVTLKGNERPSFELPTVSDEASARKRATLLSEIAGTLREAGQLDLAPTLLVKAAAASESQLGPIKRLVAAAAAGNVVKQGDREGMTFSELAKLWTSGELARRYPDHVKLKRSAHDDAGRFEKHIYPVIGDVGIARFTLDDAERVMASLTSKASRGTRTHVGQLMNRVLRLAVYPMRLIQQSPLPERWVPRARKKKAKGWLYPDEEAKLMKATAVPFLRRFAYGVLFREGNRKSEGAAFRIDLERGVVTLDENKTDSPRMWALQPNVTEAMRRAGREQVDAMLAEMARLEPRVLRDDLRTAGIDRAELFKSTNSRMAIRVHDTRTTFVTLALASGRSEAWIANRTGHTTSQMINEYLQQARTAAELELGQLAPLCEAIPELKRHRKGASTELKRRQPDQPLSSDGGNTWKVPAIPPTNGVVPADGFEPSLEDSKSSVLPLDDAGK